MTKFLLIFFNIYIIRSVLLHSVLFRSVPSAYQTVPQYAPEKKITHVAKLKILNYSSTMGRRMSNDSNLFVARFRGTEMSESTWVDRPPSSLVRILNKDGLPCPPS
ncbi:hypothetical protein DVH24_002456 [Malus domestica]|uniref:Uncharacterized protein n=1 Tax=Malus domestica TaxID=3750 RepID=A0A498IKL7_MALDO|nr:hypothetical protein DVH24_002456 [Malus domestica]